MTGSRRFTTTVLARPRGGVLVPVPFDPDAAWGAKPVHHVAGTVNGMRVRGALEPLAAGRGLGLGPAWCRDCGVAIGTAVAVVLEPEGPQRGDLADDFAAALATNPAAGAFFDALAQFYRRAYLRWIDGTKRSPQRRAARIAEVVALLEAGIKERPRPSRAGSE